MMRMRFRTDNAHIAERKALGDTYEASHVDSWATREIWDATPPAEPGDTWRTRWAVTVDQQVAGITEGPIAGYAICCPKCRQVHRWTTALGCPPVHHHKYIDANGVEQKFSTCAHSGVGSCWDWSGSADENTLTAKPSLHCVTEWSGHPTGGCGWHGFLTNGELSGA